MSRRGLLLIIDGEGRRSHGWSAGSLRTLHLAVPAGKPTGQEPDFHPIPLPFPGA